MRAAANTRNSHLIRNSHFRHHRTKELMSQSLGLRAGTSNSPTLYLVFMVKYSSVYGAPAYICVRLQPLAVMTVLRIKLLALQMVNMRWLHRLARRQTKKRLDDKPSTSEKVLSTCFSVVVRARGAGSGTLNRGFDINQDSLC